MDGQVDWVGLGTIAYEIVLHFKQKRVVELGCARGFSTFSMGLALHDLGEGGQIFAVDTWNGDEHFGYYEASRIISPPIDLLHVDGVHTFRAVTRDFQLFRRHLKPGAIVLFHDVYTVFPQMRCFGPSCLGVIHRF